MRRFQESIAAIIVVVLIALLAYARCNEKPLGATMTTQPPDWCEDTATCE